MDRREGLVVAVAVTAFALVTTLVSSASGAPLDFLVLDFVTGMTFVAAGLAAVWFRPGSPAGPALLGCGALWYLSSYGPTNQPVVTHVGLAFKGYYDLVLAALLLVLSSSTRRLEPRWIVVAVAASMALRSAGWLLLHDPVRLFGCEACAPNPFAVFADRSAFEAVEIASNTAICTLLALVAVIAARRLLAAGPVARRARWPLLVTGVVAMAVAAFDAFEYAWSIATGSLPLVLGEPWDEIVSWSMFGARVLVPIGFLVGTLRMRGAAGPLAPFAAGLTGTGGGGTLGAAVRSAVGDASLVLLRPAADGAWVAEDGAPASLPRLGDQRATTFVGGLAEERLGALVHDPALSEQPELLEAVTRILGLALENERLEAELRDQLQAVTDSRQRIVAATEEERRRVERDLHDGAQQRLVGVLLALEQARATAAVPAAVRDRLDAATAEAGAAIRELRELARGIHPAILEDEGLGPAVAALARRASIPVEVRADLHGRLPRLVESTAYFTIAEALTNTQRHARATHASVRIEHAGTTLDLEVDDDGQGGAEPERGTGLRGLADRVMAVGGRLDVLPRPGGGTRVRATIPVR